MPERILKKSNYFDKLEALMRVLREECPWDKAQTLTSLRSEATDFLVFAISSGDREERRQLRRQQP